MTIFSPGPSTIGEMPNCYLDASDIHERVLRDSTYIAEGHDKSDNNQDVEQTTEIWQPIVNTAGINNKDTWKSGRPTDFLSFSPSLSLGSKGTLIFVCDREVIYNASYVLSGDGGSATPALLCNFSYESEIKAFAWFDGATRGIFSVNATGPHVMAVTHDDALGTPKTHGYFDGVEVWNGDFPDWSGRNLTTILGISGSYYFGNFCEFHSFIGRILPPNEIYQRSRALMNKWGI